MMVSSCRKKMHLRATAVALVLVLITSAKAGEVWQGTAASPKPDRREGHAVAANADATQMFLSGGFRPSTASSGWVFFCDSWTFVASGSFGGWSSLASSCNVGDPGRRARHSTVTRASGGVDTVYVFGGVDDKDAAPLATLAARNYSDSSSVWVSLSTTGDTVSGRSGHSSVLVGSDMFVFYGYGGALTQDNVAEPGTFNSSLFYNDIHKLNLDTLQWTAISVNTLQPMPDARFSHAMAYYSSLGRIFMTGGRAVSGAKNDLWSFDPATSSWQEITASNPPFAMYGSGVFSYNDFLILFGGYRELSGSWFNTRSIWRINVTEALQTTAAWSENTADSDSVRNSDWPGERRYTAGATLQDRVYLFSGRSSGSSAIADNGWFSFTWRALAPVNFNVEFEQPAMYQYFFTFIFFILLFYIVCTTIRISARCLRCIRTRDGLTDREPHLAAGRNGHLLDLQLLRAILGGGDDGRLERPRPPVNLVTEKLEEDFDDMCAICQEEMLKDMEVKRAPCGHIYHPDCIDEWTKKSSLCPLCRAEMTATGEAPAATRERELV